MIEVRGHARGGQGMVTAFEILAKTFSKLDRYQVQAFPAFGVERTGAPIQAFLRVARHPILNRSNIYHPQLIVVFDESLLDQVPVFQGLHPQGAILINTEKTPESYSLQQVRVYTVPATRLSLELGLGSTALPIINAAMIGAMMRIFSIDMDAVRELIRQNVPAKPEANAKAAQRAFDEMQGPAGRNDFLIHALNASETAEPVETPTETSFTTVSAEGFDAPFWSQPTSGNKTGNWRLLTPSYTTKTPPCTANCPAGTDVRQFVQLAAQRQFAEAFAALTEKNPFPGICGRVCPHFCEQNCNRKGLDGGLNIGAIERYLGDRFAKAPTLAARIRFPEKVAVIGAGPAGLTAALRLRQKGYEVTVFEALPQAGGMMRTGIPTFRLPDEVLDREIQRIEQQGVQIKLNRRVTIPELAGDFAAVITAVGSHQPVHLNLPNSHLVTDGLRFLSEFKQTGHSHDIRKGDQVAIIGGGNTAIDVARTVLRLGAQPTVYYRRTIQEMPAIAQEVEEALAEGVKIEFLSAPGHLDKGRGRTLALTLEKMELGPIDSSGRRIPFPIPGSAHLKVVHHLIAAIGQHFDSYVFNGEKIQPLQGRVKTSHQTLVFCAGDMAWGGTITEAIGSGNAVAEEVHARLRKQDYHPDEKPENVVTPKDINYAYYLRTPRHRTRIRHPETLFQNFEEVAVGLETEELIAESSRCLHCGECFSCGNCFNFCPDAAIHVDEQGRIRIDYDYCKGCGICVQECPCSAIQFQIMETVP